MILSLSVTDPKHQKAKQGFASKIISKLSNLRQTQGKAEKRCSLATVTTRVQHFLQSLHQDPNNEKLNTARRRVGILLKDLGNESLDNAAQFQDYAANRTWRDLGNALNTLGNFVSKGFDAIESRYRQEQGMMIDT